MIEYVSAYMYAKNMKGKTKLTVQAIAKRCRMGVFKSAFKKDGVWHIDKYEKLAPLKRGAKPKK